ncbi:hypothetical protein D9757_014877 [Collybiopsis confluens]|uniref:Uncharacterized protein n=1 Tax=Collybiopsis confluens TaxID=2823264 RepID=A0A8H5FP64_9AGAR|nr:hypothetical protein D9757_014877 [Collybiopsis confluens]
MPVLNQQPRRRRNNGVRFFFTIKLKLFSKILKAPLPAPLPPVPYAQINLPGQYGHLPANLQQIAATVPAHPVYRGRGARDTTGLGRPRGRYDGDDHHDDENPFIMNNRQSLPPSNHSQLQVHDQSPGQIQQERPASPGHGTPDNNAMHRNHLQQILQIHDQELDEDNNTEAVQAVVEVVHNTTVLMKQFLMGLLKMNSLNIQWSI